MKQIRTKANEVFGKFRYVTETQTIHMKPVKTRGFILDIGGGGEGVIGKLNGRQVVAIDTSEEEPQETKNEALKVMMDATDLKFLPNCFDASTAFFSLMYIPKEKHTQVFKEVKRVLKDGGKFLLWDVKIPERQKNFRVFAVRLKIKLPQEVETGYGTVWNKTQDIEYFKHVAAAAGFKIVKEWSENEIFHIEMRKNR